MILWFLGGAVALVWAVFRDPAIDYRLVMAGALLPDVVDAPLGGGRYAHSLVVGATVLVTVMVATRGHRQARRQALALPIGVLCHLLLDAVWARPRLLWWPFLGRSLAGQALPSLDHGPVVAGAEELAGALALAWGWGRFRLGDRARRAYFVRTGRLDRDLAG
jgi:membrane-bound metal-dependent hydrolase YbcI (DUF457 family)